MGPIERARAERNQGPIERARIAREGKTDPSIPQPRPNLYEKMEPDPELQSLRKMGDDLRSAAQYDFGVAPDLHGNYVAKRAAMVERGYYPAEAQPYNERGKASLVGEGLRRGVTSARDLLAGVGTAMARGARAVGGAVADVGRMSALDQEAADRTAERAKTIGETAAKGVEIAGNVGSAVSRGLGSIAEGDMGPIARGVAALGKGLLGHVEEAGYAVPSPEVADQYANRTSIPLPGLDRSFVPHRNLEYFAQHPVGWALDASLLGAAPGIALRGTGEAAIQAGSAVAKAGRAAALREAGAVGGPVPLNVAERAGGGLARAGVAVQDVGEAARELGPISLARRGVTNLAARTEIGRDAINHATAWKLAGELINRPANRSVGLRIADQEDYAKALAPLLKNDAANAGEIAAGRATADVHQVVSILEGRAFPLASEKPEILNAVKVIRDKEIAKRHELILAGVLKPSQAADRALGPWINQQTGKRIPEFGATDAGILERNSKVAAGEPFWLTPTQHKAELARFRKFQKSWNSVPDRPRLDPVYFPRFATGADDVMTLRKIAGEFFPKRGTVPARQAFEKHYSGLSYLRNADPQDVKEALFRYNAQSRKVIDSNAIVRGILESEMDVRMPGGKIVREKIAKALKLDKNGNPVRNADGTSSLLPGYRPYAPEGMLAYYRAQVDMAESVARKLEELGEPEKAIAAAVKAAFPDRTTVMKSWLAVTKRRDIYQVPEAIAKQVERNFGETPMALKLFDKGTDAWKAGVLATSPRWNVNNFIGNIVMELAAGGNPARTFKPLSAAEKAALPVDIRARGFGVNEGYRRSLGTGQLTRSGRLSAAIANSPPVRWPTNATQFLFDVNQSVDNHFRARIYLDIGRKEARNALVKKTGQAWYSSREVLEELGRMGANPTSAAKLLDKLDAVFVNFNNLQPIERQVFRRMVPFWSWYREIARITVSLPKRSPVRVQMMRGLSQMAIDADEKEFEEKVGFPKSDLKAYARRASFSGYDPATKEISMRPTVGPNPFEQAFTPDFSMLHPVLQIPIQEMYGGRTMGGGFVPFRTTDPYVEGEIGPKSGFGLRVARASFPPMRVAENWAQQATEGVVSQRYEDLSPLANSWRKYVTKEPVYPTYILDKETRKPRRVKPISDTMSQFFGVPIMRLLANEVQEQKEKEQQAVANRFSDNAWKDPAGDEAALKRNLDKHRGEPAEGFWRKHTPAQK